jgi:hypothetical protein
MSSMVSWICLTDRQRRAVTWVKSWTDIVIVGVSAYLRKGREKEIKFLVLMKGHADAKKRMCSAEINYGTVTMLSAHSQAPS